MLRRSAVLLLCLAPLLLAGCSNGTREATAAGDPSSAEVVGLTMYAVGHRDRVPALAGTGIDGHPVSLASLGRSKIVFINVWASWCTPCRTESPMLARSASALAPRGVKFLGLDEADRPQAARAFVRSTGSTYPHLVDDDGTLLRKLRMLPQRGIPSTLVIDRHGRVAARVIGQVTASDIRRIVGVLEGEA
jgi:thiol-disulfide isomerase/thioredoxin